MSPISHQVVWSAILKERLSRGDQWTQRLQKTQYGTSHRTEIPGQPKGHMIDKNCQLSIIHLWVFLALITLYKVQPEGKSLLSRRAALALQHQLGATPILPAMISSHILHMIHLHPSPHRRTRQLPRRSPSILTSKWSILQNVALLTTGAIIEAVSLRPRFRAGRRNLACQQLVK